MNETVAMSSFVIINSINVTQVEDALNEAYDRSCDLHPFLNNHRKKGNVGAKIILEHVKFLVDTRRSVACLLNKLTLIDTGSLLEKGV